MIDAVVYVEDLIERQNAHHEACAGGCVCNDHSSGRKIATIQTSAICQAPSKCSLYTLTCLFLVKSLGWWESLLSLSPFYRYGN